jgi:hypothetical protein
MSGLRFGPGAADGYPFLSRSDAAQAACLVDITITSRYPINTGFRLNAIDPLRRRILLTCEDPDVRLELENPEVKQLGELFYWQWYLEDYAIGVAVDPGKPSFANGSLMLVSRVINYLGDDVNEIVFDTVDGEVSSNEKPLVLRQGFNTEINVDNELVSIDVAPGLGQGTVSNCFDNQTRVIRKLAQATANTSGNVNLRGDECFRVQPELIKTGNGYTVSPGRFYLHDDCEQCCKCEEKAEVWRFAKQMQDRLIPLVDKYHELREIYQNKVKSIQAGNDCITRPLLNADLVLQSNNGLYLYITVCNGGLESLTDVVISVSPLYITSHQFRKKYKDVDPEFFEENKGIIEIPDDSVEFFSLHEQIRYARHLQMLVGLGNCKVGQTYSVGKKGHLKFPGDVLCVVRDFDPFNYEITTKGKQFEFFADGGMEFNFHCIEPGDTRYFTAPVEFAIPLIDIYNNGERLTTGGKMTPFEHKKIALIVHSPSHPEISVSVKTATGSYIPCIPDPLEEDNE